uniref:DNA mismatch repair protein n=1 Tax=Thermosporothrix sp. COM3 TaxID=2490863 RepID=A0A455SX15_9CHLR|nr:DNA mismatch repair protein [Thermosporothrix sp. COM3]
MRQAALQRHLERLQERIDRRLDRQRFYGMQQLATVFLGFFLCAGALAWNHIFGVLVIIGAILYFVYNWRLHKAYQQSVSRYQRRLEYHQQQLARLALDWENIPSTGPKAEQSDHPFENDLDISGDYSLHELLNTAASQSGSERLRSWLLTREPDRDTILQRQQLVRELTPMINFRAALAEHSQYAVSYGNEYLVSERLQNWVTRTMKPIPLYKLIVPLLLTALFLGTIIAYIVAHISLMLTAIPFFLCIGWSILTTSDRAGLYEETAYMSETLRRLGIIFSFLERTSFAPQSKLQGICHPCYSGTVRPSRLMKNLKLIASLSGFTQDQIGSLFFNAFLPWDAFISRRLQEFKADLSEHLPQWLDTWYELEALCSLANFAYLNPEYTMPRLLPAEADEPLLEATELGHPLIDPAVRVTNTTSFARIGDIMLLTGSNMAGKSTFLRTIGVNLCLAYAGAPVVARSFQTRLFELYACIRVTDSMADGFSYFYAEVHRLRGLLQRLEAQPRYPIFFLIDEIFKGTNNRERLIGSHAYIYALAQKRCVGALTTHDLELVTLSEELPQVSNYHFREEVVDGKMTFDYKLHVGPCPTTNALKIMQLEGLPISWPEPIKGTKEKSKQKK